MMKLKIFDRTHRKDILNEERKKDFSPLTGFKCALWEQSVLDWGINDRTINVLLNIQK